MKNILSILSFTITGFCAFAQNNSSPEKQTQNDTVTVEASCGQCQFGMKGNGCDLAIKIEGKTYFVDGVDMHKLGDAHAKDGMCNAVRKAKVTGEVTKGRYKATSFMLLPATEEKK